MKTALLALLAGSLANLASAQQGLQPIDLFRLDYFMTMGAEDPVAWLDDAHYLVFDAGNQPRGPSSWSKVVARTGAREFVNKAALVRSLNAGADVAAIERVQLDVGRGLQPLRRRRRRRPVRDGARRCRPPHGHARRREVGVRFSPDGETVAFIANDNLHVVPSDGGDVRALTTEGHSDLFYGRLDWVYKKSSTYGNFQGYWWSPTARASRCSSSTSRRSRSSCS